VVSCSCGHSLCIKQGGQVMGVNTLNTEAEYPCFVKSGTMLGQATDILKFLTGGIEEVFFMDIRLLEVNAFKVADRLA